MMMSTNGSGHVLIVERPGAWVFGSNYGFAAGHVTDASSVGCVQRWSLNRFGGWSRLPAVVNERPKQPVVHVPDADQLIVA
jgi:hypothetical protein